jgi:nucleotide-binding universal stress UspA family protein
MEQFPAASRRGWLDSGRAIRQREGSGAVAGLRQVIAGVSGSPGNIVALRYAGDMARLRAARLVAVHAWVPPGGDIAERRAPSPDLRRLWQEAARARLQDALGIAWGGRPVGLELECLVVRGSPGQVLVDVAGSPDDLLVVGTGRRSGLAGIWRGRVTRYCVRHAGCPVLTVPPPALATVAGQGLRSWSFRHRELTADAALRELHRQGLEPGGQ